MTDALPIRRLLAWHQAAPVRRRERLPIPKARDEDTFITAFIRAGGEQVPWAFAYGHPGAEPEMLTLPDPWDRDALASATLIWGEALLEFLGDDAQAARLKQVWLPGATHRSLLHLLAIAFSWVRKGPRADRLRRVGRACSFLTREAQRPGQLRVIDATELINACYDLPAEPLRCQHLGFDLAWLDAIGPRAERFEAAAEAEQLSVATTLDPDTERRLDARVRAGKPCQGILESELRRRFRLTEAARQRLFERFEDHPALGPSLDQGDRAFQRQLLRVEEAQAQSEDAFAPHPSKDAPSASASLYYVHLHGAELARQRDVHHDRAALAEEIEAGRGFRGTIREVVDRGAGRKTEPQWTLRCEASIPLRLRIGKTVELAGAPGRVGIIRDIRLSAGARELVVEITKGKTQRLAGQPHAADAGALLGTEAAFVESRAPGLAWQRSFEAWDKTGPGAWLTAAAGSRPAPRQDSCQRDLLGLVSGLKGGGE